MKIFVIIAAVVCFIALALIFAAYICYRLVFSAPKRRECNADDFDYPTDDQYAPQRGKVTEMLRFVDKENFEDVFIESFDGTKLHANYYQSVVGAPVVIMFHGYRSQAKLDFCGGICVFLQKGYNVLLVDQRAHGKSGGKCLTFGVKERYDCLYWARYAEKRFGEKCKIYLDGMSMGAATVLMAADLGLPENVAGIIADCGYTSPAAIVKKVICDRKYPVRLFYLVVRLGGILFAGFDLNSASAVESMKKCKIPVFFAHGEADRFVPCAMGRENYEACACEKKRLLTVSGAGHGLSFMVDKNAYISALNEFFKLDL